MRTSVCHDQDPDSSGQKKKHSVANRAKVAWGVMRERERDRQRQCAEHSFITLGAGRAKEPHVRSPKVA